MITLEEWALVRRLHLNEGVSQREIAQRLGIARNTIAIAIKSEKHPQHGGVVRSSAMRELRHADRPRVQARMEFTGLTRAKAGSLSYST
ncbi:hypothetical protein [Cryobacterium aureum]|uniref:hypothetical protein n=1 Tax=Cryobacterium aureum TaxID=995037 RepID=UPI001F0BA066|nr:hypothetical protein [Cryobacterium aureum]